VRLQKSCTSGRRGFAISFGGRNPRTRGAAGSRCTPYTALCSPASWTSLSSSWNDSWTTASSGCNGRWGRGFENAGNETLGGPKAFSARTCEVSRRSSSPSRRSGHQRPSGKSCAGEAVPLAFVPLLERAKYIVFLCILRACDHATTIGGGTSTTRSSRARTRTRPIGRPSEGDHGGPAGDRPVRRDRAVPAGRLLRGAGASAAQVGLWEFLGQLRRRA